MIFLIVIVIGNFSWIFKLFLLTPPLTGFSSEIHGALFVCVFTKQVKSTQFLASNLKNISCFWERNVIQEHWIICAQWWPLYGYVNLSFFFSSFLKMTLVIYIPFGFYHLITFWLWLHNMLNFKRKEIPKYNCHCAPRKCADL